MRGRHFNMSSISCILLCSLCLVAMLKCTELEAQPCGNNPCLHGGTCIHGDIGNTYDCKCAFGFIGRNCESEDTTYARPKEVDPCKSNPCLNDGVCALDHVLLPDIHYICLCLATHHGKNCEQLNDSCNDNPCLNGGTCHTYGAGHYLCFCPAGVGGRNCEIGKN